MKYLEPSVVIVDDVKEEIQGILDYYQSSGIGSKWFNASYIEGVDMPEKVFSDISLLFLDLFYSEIFDAEQCSNWVQSIIPEKSFYILILWTKDSAKAELVIERLKKINRLPFTYFVKSKIDYSVAEIEKYDFTRLFTEINDQIDALHALDEVFIWKKSIKYSTNNVLGNLTKNSQPSEFNNKLRNIIINHGGNCVKKMEDSNRKRFILFDALDSVLISNTKNNVTEQISSINSDELYNLTTFSSPEVDRELNSWFHFKLDKEITQDLVYPGIISEYKENDWKTMYSIHDDDIVNEYISLQVDEKIIIKDIVLLLSRPCDIAQNKYGKNLKLLSGLMIINPIRKKNKFKGKDTKPDSIKIYDHLFLNNNENDVTFLFDFRYNFSVPESQFQAEFTNIKIFNKELLSEMQVEYSSYSSRLGITQVI